MDEVLSESMTPRELDILQAMVEGLTNAEIAHRLVLSSETVKWYVKQLYSKLAAHSRAEAIAQAIELGLASSPGGSPTRIKPHEESQAGCPLINPLPQDVSGRYVGNVEKVALLGSLLGQHSRLICIYGQAGAGKTALACKTLGDLLQNEQNPLRLSGIVCLSAVSTGITLNRLFTDLGRLLTSKDQFMLAAVARNSELAPAKKIEILIEKLAGKRIILLLDNLETIQNPASGEITEPGIQQLIEMVLRQSSALTLVITSREPLLLPGPLKTWEHLISLEDGLPRNDAIALLRKFDPSGITGLRDAPEQDLGELAERLGGFPRALESVAGILLEDPLLHLAGVKEHLKMLEGEVSAAAVRQALAHLDGEAMRVLQGLAVFAQPISYDGLAYLLAPYLGESKLRLLLGRLIRACFVKANRVLGQYTLHPLDQSYCYNTIPAGSKTDTSLDTGLFTRIALHGRVATYYHEQRLPRSKRRLLTDLEPQLNEFNHLVSAAKYEEAAKLLLELDADNLWEWGYKDLLRSLYSKVEGSLADPRLVHQVARRQAWLKFFTAGEEADLEFARLLESAREQGFVKEEADAWDDLAQCFRRGNRNLRKGLDYHQKALTLYQQMGDRRGEAEALGGLGAIYVQIEPGKALECLQAAASIQKELGNYSSLSFLMTMSGTAYSILGETEQALKTIDGAVRIAEESRSLEALLRAQVELGRLYAAKGQIEAALGCIEKVRAVSQEISGLPMTPGLMFLVGQAATFLGLARYTQEGRILLESAIREASVSMPLAVPFGRFFMSLLLMLEGNIAEAHRLFPYDLQVLTASWAENNFWVIALIIKSGDLETASRLLNSIIAPSSPSNLADSAPDIIELDAPLLFGMAYAGLGLLNRDPVLVAKAVEYTKRVNSTRSFLQDMYLRMIELLIQEPGGEILAPVREVLDFNLK